MRRRKLRMLARILAKKQALDSLRPLPPRLVEKLREQMQIEFTYNSNAIEGNTLSLRETQLVIREGITVRGRSLREHLEARNHPDAIAYVERLAQAGTAISPDDVLRVHAILLRGIDDEHDGQYRTGLVRVTGATFLPPPAQKIPALVRELLHTLAENPEELSPIELAAMFHHRFVAIHPFLDGNGRTARLLTNVILTRHGYPFTTLLRVDRPVYLRALGEADSGNLKPLVTFLAKCVERSLDIYLLAFDEDAGLLTLTEASKLTPYSQEYLSLLARRGYLGAFKLRRNWVITRAALTEYLQAHQSNA